AEHVLTASISLPNTTYKETAKIADFYDRLLDDLRATPGVLAVGAGSDLPWTGWDDNVGGFGIQGETPPPREFFHARYHEAAPGFFSALGVPIVRGRTFDAHDNDKSRPVMIINEAMAKFWKRGDPIGGRFTFADHPKESDWITIVGIVKDVKDSPKDSSAQPAFWWPMRQEPFPFARDSSVAIRSTLDPNIIAGRLRSAVSNLDPTLAVSDIHTMDQVASKMYASSRFALILIALFAVLAVLLAAIGAYGVIAYSVTQRMREFGLRIALGATRKDVLTTVLANGMKLAIAGTAAGILLGVAASRLLGSLLYEVTPLDPVAICATASITIVIAALACYFPAARATRADPMTALRAD
ncbi:MAG: FtsX-like permease family protein, partial [Alphaproteobacteria bacterium]|nr:FtsX-like permease family protein [Alphaproteobacteria bacterium]